MHSNFQCGYFNDLHISDVSYIRRHNNINPFLHKKFLQWIGCCGMGEWSPGYLHIMPCGIIIKLSVQQETMQCPPK